MNSYLEKVNNWLENSCFLFTTFEEYKLIHQKIDCANWSCDKTKYDIKDYYEKITKEHKEFLDKHKLIINKYGEIIDN